ncbi:MAG: trimethylamine methyltransferase family protein [Armatimonadota bacterium]
MRTWNCAEVLTPAEVDALHAQALAILDEIGVYTPHPVLQRQLEEVGARVDRAADAVHFPRAWTERFIADSREEYDDDDSLEVSCTLPYGKRRDYAGGIETTAGTYPQYYLGMDNVYRPHTLATAAEATRLADALPHIDRLGVMGSPSDVPSTVDPLYMRLIAWKHAERKLSNCGEVRDPRLIPYIVEMGRIIADHKQAPVSRYTFAEVELLSPLRLGAVEAEIFVQFWQAGLKAGIGFMPIAGASTPATLAASVSIMLAESLFVSILYRACYGLRKLYLQANGSILDMRAGMFPFARPERTLQALAMGQMARHYRAGLWASAVQTDSKGLDIEAGYGASFNAIPAIMAGTIGLECYGLASSADANSPIALVLDDEYLGGVKRFVQGFEITEDTLAWELIKERGIGGNFLDAEHTAEHYRREHWQPDIFSREALNDWLAGDQKLAADRARDKAERLLRDHHPRGMDEATEQALLEVIHRAERELVGVETKWPPI